MLNSKQVKNFFNKFCIKDTGCWEWKDGCAFTSNGYGMFYLNAGMKTAHRVSYSYHKGEIPNGAWVLHTCDNRRCVNPEHLYLGDREQNVKDMIDRNRRASTAGENAGKAKLTWKKVNRIREFNAIGISQVSLANQFNMSHQMISRICRGEAWLHEK